MNINIRVLPSDGAWKVKSDGASKALRLFDTKKDAVDYAREVARNQKGELHIHKKDGKIQQRDSYGNDPFPPRG